MMKFNQEDVFCFTGKCPEPRSVMEAIAINAGASVTKSIAKSTTILVIADPNSMSAKARKARDNGIIIISPSEFFELCNKVEYVSDNGTFTIESNTIIEPKPIKQRNKKKRHSSARRIEL